MGWLRCVRHEVIQRGNYGPPGDFSNDEGVCWPSIETIARQIGAGMSTVRTAIARLEAEGWLTRKARRQVTAMRRMFISLTLRSFRQRHFLNCQILTRQNLTHQNLPRQNFDASKSGKKAGFHPSESGGDPSVKSKHDPSDKKSFSSGRFATGHADG